MTTFQNFALRAWLPFFQRKTIPQFMFWPEPCHKVCLKHVISLIRVSRVIFAPMNVMQIPLIAAPPKAHHHDKWTWTCLSFVVGTNRLFIMHLSLYKMIGHRMPYYGLPYLHVVRQHLHGMAWRLGSVLPSSNYLVEKFVLIGKTSVRTTNNYRS